MKISLKKGCSVLLCVALLVTAGCGSTQPGNTQTTDGGGVQTAQAAEPAATQETQPAQAAEPAAKEEAQAAQAPELATITDDPVPKQGDAGEEAVSGEPEPADVVIQVAVTVEQEGVLKAFGIEDAERCYDTVNKYKFSYYRFQMGEKSIVLIMQPYMGMTYCSSLCTRAILAFHPELICMTGICAGRASKVNLGDIVVASSVFNYSEGKQYVDRFAPRPKTRSLDYLLSEFVNSEILDDQAVIDRIRSGYGNAPQGIAVSFHSMASGVMVVDDPSVMERIVEMQDDTVALDMEGYALAAAADMMDTKWLVIKTVQDFADGNKSETEGDIRPFAAYSSAELLEIILENLDLNYYF